MIIKREILEELKILLNEYPVVTILVPQLLNKGPIPCRIWDAELI